MWKKKKGDPFVAVLMGSDSDLPVMQTTLDTLDKLGIKREVRVTSAHRTPQATMEYVTNAEKRGCAVFIAAAGLAAHLAGTVAAHTVKPVIGVPLATGDLKGFDALLSTVMMPGGIPVATVAVGKPGAKNAAYLAGQMLSLTDSKLEEKLRQDRDQNAKEILAKNKSLNK